MRFSQNGPAAHKMMSKVNATLDHSSILQLYFENITTILIREGDAGGPWRHLMRRIGGVRLAERGVVAARWGAPGAGNYFLYAVGRMSLASDVEFDRGIEKTAVLGQNEY